MMKRSQLHLLFVIGCIAPLAVPPAADAQPSDAYIAPTQHGSSAVDVYGVTHDEARYRVGTPPWLAQRVRAVAPKYPQEDRRRRNEGTGMFELHVDPRTGKVTKVIIRQSTGFRSLDGAAVDALQKWQWKPGRWKQVNMPVTFTMQSAGDRPVNAIPVPSW